MSMAELMESITDELTEQLEYDASQREIKQDSEMSLVEFAEKIAPFPLSEFQNSQFENTRNVRKETYHCVTFHQETLEEILYIN